MTVAAFMELALYDPDVGYYARASQRSGRAGDFFTSVDVGPLFGELLEIQLEEMAEILEKITAEDAEEGIPGSTAGAASSVSPASRASRASPASSASSAFFDLVEAGAGNGRLSADILRAARRRDSRFCDRIRLHLVEASAQARGEQPGMLGDVADRLVFSSAALPTSFEGALVANELLDALPVHQVVMREDGLREVYVQAVTSHQSAAVRPDAASRFGEISPALGRVPEPSEDGSPVASPGRLVTHEGPLSTPALADHLTRLGIVLEPGWRAEIGLRAVEWVREAARRLRRGFIILIDYGHDARELYSATHATGTLTAFSRHTTAGADSAQERPMWLERPGEQDLTAHVDFTSVGRAAEAEGLVTLGFLDQTYFLIGLLTGGRESFSFPDDSRPSDLRPLKTLLMPGGLGSTHKVLILGKGVGTPSLRGCSFRQRVT